jgi:hypothetical protein
MFVVFDLDGTLALTEHRSHFLTGPGPKDWRGFYAACDQDEANRPICEVLIALWRTGATIEIWTGRSDEVADKTMTWLFETGIGHALAHTAVRMRKSGDHRHDTVIKAEWIEQFGKPDLVFEDRARMVEFYRERGIVCCQVAPGDF